MCDLIPRVNKPGGGRYTWRGWKSRNNSRVVIERGSMLIHSFNIVWSLLTDYWGVDGVNTAAKDLIEMNLKLCAFDGSLLFSPTLYLQQRIHILVMLFILWASSCLPSAQFILLLFYVSSATSKEPCSKAWIFLLPLVPRYKGVLTPIRQVILLIDDLRPIFLFSLVILSSRAGECVISRCV